ncbi:hypothetical protein DRQ25_13490 [Candidatus Fermentibacteria bacterium]|nr:MAG: hypothetical protein DRQ25_13490 [Candidatus Fermentibacteria bacterium]
MSLWDSYIGMVRERSDAMRGGNTKSNLEQARLERASRTRELMGQEAAPSIMGNMGDTGIGNRMQVQLQPEQQASGYLGSAQTPLDQTNLQTGLLNAGYTNQEATGLMNTLAPQGQNPTAMMQNVAATGVEPGTPAYQTAMSDQLAKSGIQIENYPAGYTGGLPDFQETYKPTTFNVSGVDRDLGTPSQVATQSQFKRRGRESDSYFGPVASQQRQKAATARFKNVSTIDEVLRLQEKYTGNAVGGTGPLASIAGWKKFFDEETETLNAMYNKLEMDVVRDFASDAGSRAIDSNAEREVLKGTIGGIKQDDRSNFRLLLGQQAIQARIERKAGEQDIYMRNNGTLDGFTSGYNTDMAVYKKGSPVGTPPEFIPKGRMPEGYLGIDDYIETLIDNDVSDARSSSVPRFSKPVRID